MKTTRSLDLKVSKLTQAVNMVVQQVTSSAACAGFENTSQYKDSGLTTAQLAAILNYGRTDKSIPPRPFMELAITRDGKRRLNKIYKSYLAKLFRDELTSIKYQYEKFSAGQNPRYQKRAVKEMMDELASTLYQNIFQGISSSRIAELSESYMKRTGKTHFLDGSTEFIEQIQAWVLEDEGDKKKRSPGTRYSGTQIHLRQVSSLRGDQKTKGGNPTDGGYARKSFFVETHLEGEEVSHDGLKKTILDKVKPMLLKNFAGSKYKRGNRK